MGRLFISYLLGILSFILAITGIFSLLLSIPGLLLAIGSLKLPEKKLKLPIGYQGKVGSKKISAQPFITSKYLAYLAIGLNAFSIAVALFTSFAILALFTTATR